MESLYEQLTRKLDEDPRLTRRGGPRFDLGLLLFNAREPLYRLWRAAERSIGGDTGALAELRVAVEELRPIFGERQTERR